VQRRHYLWILAGVEFFAFASGIVTGIVVTLILIVIYLASLRVHPRIRHSGWRSCNGTGEHRGAVFTWTFRRCPGCSGGRLIRWGAARWGSGPIRTEAARQRESRAAARDNHSWR
jgi:hypothetical protein